MIKLNPNYNEPDLVVTEDIKVMVPYTWVHADTESGVFLLKDAPIFDSIYRDAKEVRSQIDSFMFLTSPIREESNGLYYAKIIGVNDGFIGWVRWGAGWAKFKEIMP